MGLQAAQSPAHPPGAGSGHSVPDSRAVRRHPRAAALCTHLAGGTRTGHCSGPGEALSICRRQFLARGSPTDPCQPSTSSLTCQVPSASTPSLANVQCTLQMLLPRLCLWPAWREPCLRWPSGCRNPSRHPIVPGSTCRSLHRTCLSPDGGPASPATGRSRQLAPPTQQPPAMSGTSAPGLPVEAVVQWTESKAVEDDLAILGLPSIDGPETAQITLPLCHGDLSLSRISLAEGSAAYLAAAATTHPSIHNGPEAFRPLDGPSC
jgi:hypothetical protein